MTILKLKNILTCEQESNEISFQLENQSQIKFEIIEVIKQSKIFPNQSPKELIIKLKQVEEKPDMQTVLNNIEKGEKRRDTLYNPDLA